ncbi:MAG: hypothetical protein BGO69_18035 [Bacteroidetes bacterium 46-16]|nr:MAG: hypothetical protein BGO69_18035 [Bacteroidetes bacterium 46-16]
MKKTLLCVPVSILAIVAISSCRSGNKYSLTNSIPVRQDFEVVYDKATMGTTATAVFRSMDATGSRIQENVTVNGEVPNYEPLSSTYSWNSNGYQNVTFVMTKGNGQSFTNTVNIGDTIGAYFPENMDLAIHKSNGLNFNATGLPFAANENLTIMLIGKDQFGNYAIETKYSATSVVSITRNDLNSFKNGTLNIQIKRQRTLNIQQSDSTGGGSRIVSLVVQKAFTLTD